MHTAKPVRTGVNQIGVNAVGFSPQTDSGGVTVPTFEIQVRRGVSERADFGAKYSFPLTLTLDYNLLLVDSGVAVSIDPTISPMYLSTTETSADGTTASASMFWLWGYLPVLIDVINTDSLALTLSPRIGFLYASGAASSDADSGLTFADSGINWMWGAGVGLRINLGESFAIMPEMSVLAPFEGGGGMILQPAVGFLF